MTAFNVIEQPSAAYLITDTACMANGLVTHFQPKVLELLGEPAALAFTGNVFMQDLLPALTALTPRTVAELVGALPHLIRAGEAAWRENRGSSGTPEFTLGLAAFDRQRGVPAAYVCGNDPALFGSNRYEPYSVRAIYCHAVLDRGAAFGRPESQVNLCDPASFDPIQDAPALLQQQRRELVDGWSIIGGQGLVTIVDAKGVRSVTVCEWPDEVGKPIQPQSPRVDLCPFAPGTRSHC